MFDIWLNSAQKKAPSRVTERHIDVLEAYISEVDGSFATTLAAALYDNFNDLRFLPPSKDAFRQHLLRACNQARYLW